ncbi:MAG: biotin synthase BioB [Candidatus Omnitrophota bacterium]
MDASNGLIYEFIYTKIRIPSKVMDNHFYSQLTRQSLGDQSLDGDICLKILASSEVELLSLLHSAFEVRKKYFGKEVLVHIIDNVQNGSCAEDCRYCAQSRHSQADIIAYACKSEDEILKEAEHAYKMGAFRHCLVFSGKRAGKDRIQFIASVVRKIKENYSMQVCVSAGILDEESLKILSHAGVDRINHNLNTSQEFYPKICTTHTFDDRLKTVHLARQMQLEVCSGIIVGMGEQPEDIVSVAKTLRKYSVASIPVNFLIPIKGIPIRNAKGLTPEYCLRVLCLMRFLNPSAEIRIAAGRELHLRDMQVFGLYPANSLFLDGYLNAKGSDHMKTLQMIKDAGFAIKSDHGLDELLCKEEGLDQQECRADEIVMKNLQELRPNLNKVQTKE